MKPVTHGMLELGQKRRDSVKKKLFDERGSYFSVCSVSGGEEEVSLEVRRGRFRRAQSDLGWMGADKVMPGI